MQSMTSNPSPRCYWFTGLPASGKTTLASAWAAQLQAGGAQAYVLDGDVLRQGLCADLGLGDADRAENIRRAGCVAKLLVDAGVTAVCAFVSPFAADRQKVRALFAPGQFVEIYLSTPLAECARRDPKQLYAKARAGQIKGLTGWDAPYEAPQGADLVLNTTDMALADALEKIHVFYNK